MRSSQQRAASHPIRRWLLGCWVLGAALVGAGAGLLVFYLEDANLNDLPSGARGTFIFMQAAILLGVLAGALSPTAWMGKRGSSVLAALLAGVTFYIIISVRAIDAGNANGLFFGCLTLPFLLVCVLAGIFGSWIGALLADMRRGDEG
jgi:hypothetical protein